jgi:hypothetical protein
MTTGDETPPFAGRWRVEHATLPDGTFAYTGTIETRAVGATFALDWDISAGRYVGIGIPHRGHLMISCGETFAGLGIALYSLDSAGRATGRWSTPELGGGVGQARFVSRWAGTFEGEHRVAHTHPVTGEETLFDLRVTRDNAIYAVTWSAGELELAGLGIPMDGGVALGWYPDLKQLAFLDYALEPGGRTIEAVWALGGYTTLGTERLARL